MLRCVEQLWAIVAEHDGLLSGEASGDAKQKDLAALATFGWNEGNWAVSLEAWRALRPRAAVWPPTPAMDVHDHKANDSMRFRAKCKRAESATGHTHKEHGFTSIDAARVFGGALKQRFGWTVGLERGAFDLDVRLAVAGKSCRALLFLTTTISSGSDAHGVLAPSRLNLSLSRTALRPAIASAMAQVRLIADSPGGAEDNVGASAEPAAEIVVDPMCGGGSIGCEVAAGWPGAFVLNGDVEHKEAARLAQNLNSLRRRALTQVPRASSSEATAEQAPPVGGIPWAARMDGARWDATRLPVRSGVVDSVVTDLPWGKVCAAQSA